MAFRKRTHPDNPPARNGCTCSCHTSLARVKHFRACCPSEPKELPLSDRIFQQFDLYQKYCAETRAITADNVFMKNAKGELVPASYMYDGMGLGEAGEVQNKIKKIVRDNDGVITDEMREAILGELGGLLWYMAMLAHDVGIDFRQVPLYNIRQLRDRRARGVIKGSGDNR